MLLSLSSFSTSIPTIGFFVCCNSTIPLLSPFPLTLLSLSPHSPLTLTPSLTSMSQLFFPRGISIGSGRLAKSSSFLVAGRIHSVPFFSKQFQHFSSKSHKDVEIKLKLLRLVRNFRISGHFIAKLDPLNLSTHLLASDVIHQSDICQFLKNDHEPNLSIFDLQDVPLHEAFYLGNELKSMGKEEWTLSELIHEFKKIYCGHVSVEYTHIENNERRHWIQDNVEGKYGAKNWKMITKEEKKYYWSHLLRTDHTLKFLDKKFSSAKIFGIDGCEVLLPALWAIANTSSQLGAEYLEMGMTHRGRINVLHNFFQKSFASICNKFNEDELYSGDVKFHLGARANIQVQSDQEMHISLCANPSHLEAVYPVVIGKTKAKQFYVDDKEMKRVIPLVLHG